MKAEIGIIGGSGLYSMPGFEAQEEVVIDTPFGQSLGSLRRRRAGGRRVAFLARHGRGHRISPSELNFRANIYGMKSLGVERILSLSAVGSLKEEHRPHDFVIPDQFFDRTRGRVSTFFGEGLVAHISFADPICPQLAEVVACRVPGRRRPRQEGRYLSLHGGPRVLHESGIGCLSLLGHGRDRHDQPAGGQARARGRNLLRHDRYGHRLRLLASGPRRRKRGPDYRNLAPTRQMRARWWPAAVAAMPEGRACKCGSALAHAILTDRKMFPNTRAGSWEYC